MSVLNIHDEIKRQLEISPNISDRDLAFLVEKNLKLTCFNYIMQHIKFIRGADNDNS